METEYAFLSYAKEDSDVVRRVHARLRKDGVQSWIDEHDSLPGQDWDAAIRGAIRRSRAFVVFLSRRSVTKTGYIQREIREGLEAARLRPSNEVFVVPVLLDECAVPEELRRWQWIDLHAKGGYAKLCRTLIEKANLRRPIRLVPRPMLTDPVELLLFEMLETGGHFLYGRVPGYGHCISQGHFIAIFRKLSSNFLQLRQRVSDFRRLNRRMMEKVLPLSAPWRRPTNALKATGNPLPFGGTVLLSEASATCVNDAYWRLAQLVIAKPTVYLTDSLGPVYIEEAGVTRLAIMPLRMDDDDLRQVERWKRSTFGAK